VLAGLVAGSVLAELLFRVIEATPLWRVLPASEVSLYGPDPFTGYRHRVGARGVWLQENRSYVTISNLGLRDRDRVFERSSATRAVVIGDSAIEALQVDLQDTAVATAERELARRHPGAEVINLGLAGATPAVDMARLQSLGLSLHPDLAIVVVQIGDVLVLTSDDDSGWTAYKAGADGEVRLSYGFRQARGYKFRTSSGGRLFYWALDHSALARVLNSRKNVGFFAEWPRKPENADGPAASDSCGKTLHAQHRLWIDGQPAAPRKHLDAFLRDLAQLRRDKALPIVVAFRDLPSVCEGRDDLRRSIVDTIGARLTPIGLKFADMDGLARERAGIRYRTVMHGFGSSRGGGHLNQQGNRIYGEIIRDLIETSLSPR
jgi:hypothetical protein